MISVLNYAKSEPILETTVWPTTGKCAWVCITQHLHEQPIIHFLADLLSLQAMFVSLPRLRAALESSPDFKFSDYSTKTKLHINLTKQQVSLFFPLKSQDQ